MKEIVLENKSLDTIERLWLNIYMPQGYKVIQPVHAKWKWKRFRYVYRMVMATPNGTSQDTSVPCQDKSKPN